MRKRILFISPVPTLQNSKDGMVQRVVAIGKIFGNEEKCFLELSYSRNFWKQSSKSGAEENFKGNVIMHAFSVLKRILRADIIYVHSVMSALNIVLFLPFIRKKIVLDVHGLVPEENEFNNKKFMAQVFSLIEGYLMQRKVQKAIFVTKAMEEFYKTKYPGAQYKPYLFPIYPYNLVSKNGTSKENIIPHLPNIKVLDSDVVFIYSGNLQKWQNIDLMLGLIDSHKHVKHYKFFILTGEPDLMKSKLAGLGLDKSENIFLDSVSPSELSTFYRIAHYGFILRDDIPLNRVANPTKLIEYLSWQIIPVVKFPEIGDFFLYNYEYLPYDQIDEKLTPKKSVRNQNIAREICREKSREAFYDFIIKGLSE